MSVIQKMFKEKEMEWFKQHEDAERAIKAAMAYGQKALTTKSASEKDFYNTKAIETLTQEIEKQPHEPMLSTLYISRGDLLVAGKEYEKAREDFKNIPLDDVKLVENFAKRSIDLTKKVHAGLFSVEYSLGNYEKAVEHFIKMRMGENIPEDVLKDTELNHYAKAEMFFSNGLYSEAIKEYGEVLCRDPEFKSETLRRFGTPPKDMFFFKLALNEIGRKDIESAKKYCERALEINPKNKEVKEALKKINKSLENKTAN